MDVFALYTFALKLSIHAQTVELYGSWDNFSRPWPLHRDAHRGRGHWTACHTFENIIFDGIRPEWSKPRNGPLKQGGRYWYFYRLDDDEEYCDTAVPTTTDCPLLPGQHLNLLDVPIQVPDAVPRSRSASVDITFTHQPVMTLNPEDRYKKIKRQASKLMRQYASSDGLESSSSSADPTSLSLPRQGSNKSSKLATVQARPTTPRCISNASSSPSEMDSPCPLRPFAPTYTAEAVNARPQTRPGSDVGSSQSAQSFFTVHSKPSFFTNKALPSLPDSSLASDPTVQDHGLGISMYQQPPEDRSSATVLYSKPGRNFARPFYAAPLQVHHAQDTTSTPVLPPPPIDDTMDFSFTGMAAAFPSPNSEAASFDMASPTFTADTISTPGFTTPHRLSAQFHFDLLDEPLDLSLGDSFSSDSVYEVERRLSRLQTGDHHNEDNGNLSVSPQPRRPLSQTPSPFLNHSDAAHSDLTLKKLLTPKPSVYILDENLPPSSALNDAHAEREEMPSPSFVNRIFGELSFLGRAIS
ncbi:Eukaryotic translation initiation factor 4E-1 [Sphaceloma murrayae]|uniref:Eukaryotic translation initiation factor 4E-1 n=1 Tax=Sphaceloma murrayae TaxID=2082308 RepID=A0A2K1QJ53_9PEZI|nr:Eukaryotic translation initiation factor 4E-1 [Sphaceloma murrayae]